MNNEKISKNNTKKRNHTGGKFKDLTGMIFGRLTVLKRSKDVTKLRHVCWLCECSCGKWTVVDTAKIKSGHTKSCGCLSIEKSKEKLKEMRIANIKYPKMNKKDWLFYSKNINLKKSKYNVTEDHIRGLMDSQHGCCPICSKSLDHLKRGYHIDHCHKTKNVRGLLCFKCNAALGMMNDSVICFENAIKYLKKIKDMRSKYEV